MEVVDDDVRGLSTGASSTALSRHGRGGSGSGCLEVEAVRTDDGQSPECVGCEYDAGDTSSCNKAKMEAVSMFFGP